MLNKDKRILGYPKELASQFILRLPDEPAKALKELLKTGDDLNDRLTIQVQSPTKHGKVRLDDWNMRAEIIDLPIITDAEKIPEKGPEISQMLICTLDAKKSQKEEKFNKTKNTNTNEDLRKFMWPHGVLPPSKKRAASTMPHATEEEIDQPAKKMSREDE